MHSLVNDVYSSGPNIFHRTGQDFQVSKRKALEEIDAFNSESGVDVKEDATCFQLSIDMPSVRGKDIQVSVEQGALIICGHRYIKSGDGSVQKRQRLSRRFVIDTDIVDVSRAAANIFNGVLVLYAPKRSRSFSLNIPVTEKPVFEFDYEFHTPGGASLHAEL